MKNGKYPNGDRLSPNFMAMIDAGIKAILERSYSNSQPLKPEKRKRNIPVRKE